MSMYLTAQPFSVSDIFKRKVNRLNIFQHKSHSMIQFTFLALQEPLRLNRSSNNIYQYNISYTAETKGWSKYTN